MAETNILGVLGARNMLRQFYITTLLIKNSQLVRSSMQMLRVHSWTAMGSTTTRPDLFLGTCGKHARTCVRRKKPRWTNCVNKLGVLNKNRVKNVGWHLQKQPMKHPIDQYPCSHRKDEVYEMNCEKNVSNEIAAFFVSVHNAFRDRSLPLHRFMGTPFCPPNSWVSIKNRPWFSGGRSAFQHCAVMG